MDQMPMRKGVPPTDFQFSVFSFQFSVFSFQLLGRTFNK